MTIIKQLLTSSILLLVIHTTFAQSIKDFEDTNLKNHILKKPVISKFYLLQAFLFKF